MFCARLAKLSTFGGSVAANVAQRRLILTSFKKGAKTLVLIQACKASKPELLNCAIDRKCGPISCDARLFQVYEWISAYLNQAYCHKKAKISLLRHGNTRLSRSKALETASSKAVLNLLHSIREPARHNNPIHMAFWCLTSNYTKSSSANYFSEHDKSGRSKSPSSKLSTTAKCLK